MSTFGTYFKVTTYGESHGKSVGVIVDGVPPGLALDESDIQPQLTPKEGRDHGDPEVVVASGPNLVAVTEDVRHETRAKVTGEVNGIAGLPAKARANAEDDEEHGQREEGSGRHAVLVDQGVHDELENRTRQELGPPLSRGVHEIGGVRAENAGGGGLETDGADAAAALELVNGEAVVATGNLRQGWPR
ncbi:Chorismate synthase like protein [Verticillium longisporum]|nr:Chorismate synthase like protein [Verticillium longisporum]